jgi:hypothetical protein
MQWFSMLRSLGQQGIGRLTLSQERHTPSESKTRDNDLSTLLGDLCTTDEIFVPVHTK